MPRSFAIYLYFNTAYSLVIFFAAFYLVFILFECVSFVYAVCAAAM